MRLLAHIVHTYINMEKSVHVIFVSCARANDCTLSPMNNTNQPARQAARCGAWCEKIST